MACCCAGSGVCGCGSGVVFPTSFSVEFLDFSFTLFESVSGSPDSDDPTILKTFLEGLSPLFVPMVSANSSSAVYERLSCSEYNTPQNCSTYPPGFFSRERFNNGLISTLSFLLSCDGDAIAKVDGRVMPNPLPRGEVSWKISGFLPGGGGDCTIFLGFTNQIIFSGADICNLTTRQTSATAVPSARDIGGLFTGTFVRRWLPSLSYSGYAGTGIVKFAPAYNSLP